MIVADCVLLWRHSKTSAPLTMTWKLAWGRGERCSGAQNDSFTAKSWLLWLSLGTRATPKDRKYLGNLEIKEETSPITSWKHFSILGVTIPNYYSDGSSACSVLECFGQQEVGWFCWCCWLVYTASWPYQKMVLARKHGTTCNNRENTRFPWIVNNEPSKITSP